MSETNTAPVMNASQRSQTPTLPIAVTLGDASGIGPEIVLKACAQLGGQYEHLVIGDRQWIAREAAGREAAKAPVRLK